MLNILRRKKRSPWVKALLLGIVLSFLIGFGALMYIGRLWGKRAPEDIVISIDDYKVSISEFQNNMREAERRYRELLGDNFDKFASRDQLKSMVISQIVTRALLLNEAKRLNIAVSDDELRDSIANLKAFQDENGTFRLELYEHALMRYKMTPHEFEDSHRMDLTLENMRDFIQMLPFTSSIESMESFIVASDRVMLAFCSIDPKDFEAQIKLTDQEVADYFNKHKEEFKVPERRVALHVPIEIEPFKQKISLSAEDIQSFYNEKQNELFTEKESVRARHILITVSPKATRDVEDAARKLIEDIRQRALSGEDFAELAKKYSQDPGSEAQGGDLGYFSRGSMIKQFEDAAFSLDVGQISDVIRTRYGFHIIKVEDKKPERVKSLEEVHDYIVTTLTEQKANELAKAQADELATKAREKGLEVAAKEMSYEAKKSAPIAATDTPSDADGGQSFTKALFSLEKPSTVAEPLEGTKAYEVFSLAEIIKEHLPTLDEAKEKVVEQIKLDGAMNLAFDEAKKLLERSKEVGLEQAATDMKITVDQTDPFSIRGPSIPKIGDSVELKEDAFSAQQNQLLPKVYKVSDKLIVAKLIERRDANPSDFRIVGYQVTNGLNSYKREELFRLWLDQAKAKAKIKIDEKALGQI